jgi:predicted O-methyltransferase YrrM
MSVALQQRLTEPDSRRRCSFGDVPVELHCAAPDVSWELAAHDGGVTIRPDRPVPRRFTFRPMALFENARGYFDLTTAMGRFVFPRGATGAQDYRPFTQDKNRRLRKLYLAAEAMPEDDQTASPSRWQIARPAAEDLFKACKAPWTPPSDEDVRRLLTFADWPVPVEACALFALTVWMRNRGRYVVEVGSFRGSSLMVLALALRAANGEQAIVSVDPHLEQPFNRDHALLAMRQIGEDSRLIQVPKRSDAAPPLLRPASASLIFIDGDHGCEQVKADIANYDPLLAPGGCMVLHDYGFGAHNACPDPHPGVRQAVDERLFRDGRYRPVLCAHTLMAFVKAES